MNNTSLDLSRFAFDNLSFTHVNTVRIDLAAVAKQYAGLYVDALLELALLGFVMATLYMIFHDKIIKYLEKNHVPTNIMYECFFAGLGIIFAMIFTLVLAVKLSP